MVFSRNCCSVRSLSSLGGCAITGTSSWLSVPSFLNITSASKQSLPSKLKIASFYSPCDWGSKTMACSDSAGLGNSVRIPFSDQQNNWILVWFLLIILSSPDLNDDVKQVGSPTKFPSLWKTPPINLTQKNTRALAMILTRMSHLIIYMFRAATTASLI